MQTRNKSFAAFMLLGLAGCSASEAPHNAEYYTEHPDQRAEQIKRCHLDQNTENPANCAAAEDAQSLADTKASLGK